MHKLITTYGWLNLTRGLRTALVKVSLCRTWVSPLSWPHRLKLFIGHSLIRKLLSNVHQAPVLIQKHQYSSCTVEANESVTSTITITITLVASACCQSLHKESPRQTDRHGRGGFVCVPLLSSVESSCIINSRGRSIDFVIM